MVSYLSDDRHAAGIACITVGLIFIIIGLILFLVPEASGIPIWRRLTGIFILIIGSVGFITGIVFASMTSDTSSPLLVPIIDLETFKFDTLSFQGDNAEIPQELDVIKIDDRVSLQEKMITITGEDDVEMHIILPDSLSQYIFSECYIVNNNLFVLISKNITCHQLLRYIIKNNEHIIVLRERFSLENNENMDLGIKFNESDTGLHICTGGNHFHWDKKTVV